MISYIEGLVLWSNGKICIIKIASGLGHAVNYLGHVSTMDQIQLFVTTVRRETGDEYFGFDLYEDKELFELLLTVKGVGPKTAFTLMSQMARDEFIRAIALEDKNVFKKIPGVGPKTASQIILDLSSKIKNLNFKLPTKTNNIKTQTDQTTFPGILLDTTMAIKELGYSDMTITPVLSSIFNK
jgi:Holliday junction DNA helicase RuvA